jgi:hypothetical protein
MHHRPISPYYYYSSSFDFPYTVISFQMAQLKFCAQRPVMRSLVLDLSALDRSFIVQIAVCFSSLYPQSFALYETQLTLKRQYQHLTRFTAAAGRRTVFEQNAPEHDDDDRMPDASSFGGDT